MEEENIEDLKDAHAEEIDELNEQHAEEVKALQNDIDELRTALDDVYSAIKKFI